MIFNDEPSYKDELGYYTLVRRVGHRVLKCNPPYVIGVCGSWGSGKTSFLRQLWAYLKGEFENEGGDFKALGYHERIKWFDETEEDFDKQMSKRKLELIWFNPWQHQFESSPLVALLHEIRRQFSFRRKLFDKTGKLTDVALHSTLNALAELAKELKIPIPSAKGIMERGREYEAERFSTMLSSQRFREFFEGAIKEITKEKKGQKGLLVIFIDDLDRCEGDVAYRLLEALKLYLNASNCVYVLGLDQQHLESSIAKALSGEKETWRYRPLARDYLSKMFQGLFPLPVPRSAANYVNKVLSPEDDDFKQKLESLFDFKDGDLAALERALDENLPHNPRKIKSFIASWKLYLDLLPDQPAGEKLDWRLTLILHYLAQFEEPLFRKVEEAPAFYNDHIVQFCFNGQSNSWMFDGLERPYEMIGASSTPPPLDPDTGGTGTTVVTSASISHVVNKDDSKAASPQRIFWISRLIIQLAKEKGVALDLNVILRHLLHTGDAAK